MLRFTSRNVESSVMNPRARYPQSRVLAAFTLLGLSSLFALAKTSTAQSPATGPGWYLTGYAFKDGTLEKESVLAGSSARMKDRVSFTGDRGNLEISQHRTDIKTGKLLAGVKYRVTWSEPPALLKPQEKAAFDYEVKTLSSLVWKIPQQTMHINQGTSGVYFVTPDGTRYLTKDLRATLTTEKVIEKGTPGVKRVLQMNFGNGFAASYSYEWRDGEASPPPVASEAATMGGWVLTGYAFKDGTLEKESVLAGSSARMKDRVSFTGDRGNLEISQHRTDIKTGKLLAGVKYRVTWSEPPALLKPQEKAAFDYEVKTLSSLVWKIPQQTMHIDQGASGVYFVAPNGTKYLTKDLRATLTTEKVIERGTPGAKRVLQMNFGNGFAASYSYEWR